MRRKLGTTGMAPPRGMRAATQVLVMRSAKMMQAEMSSSHGRRRGMVRVTGRSLDEWEQGRGSRDPRSQNRAPSASSGQALGHPADVAGVRSRDGRHIFGLRRLDAHFFEGAVAAGADLLPDTVICHLGHEVPASGALVA